MVKAQGTGPILRDIEPGDMAERVRAFDWSATPLGAAADWSPSLRLAIDMIMAANVPMALRWGPELILIHNDAYKRVLGAPDGDGLGQKFEESEPSLRALFGPAERSILASALRR